MVTIKNKKKIKTANKKGFFKFKGLDGNNYKLTLKEKKFCLAYLDFSGNGVEAVFNAGYKPKNALVAKSIAYENLTKPHIIAYVDLKLEEYGFDDKNVEKQHLFTLNQFADLGAKNKAIDMYYKRKGLYAPEKKELSGTLSLTKLLEEADKENR